MSSAAAEGRSRDLRTACWESGLAVAILDRGVHGYVDASAGL